MKALRLIALLFLLGDCLAQNQNNLNGGGSGTQNGAGAPVGSCSAGALYTNNSSGEVYGCQAGSWLLTGPGAAGTTALNSVLDPSANKAFTMAANTLNFNWSANTSTANPFSVSDFSTNTGTGYLFTVSTGSSSATKPFRVCYRGTTNCFNFDTTTLTTSGSAVIDATKLSGNLPALNGASLTSVDAATLQTHAAAYFQQALTLTTTGTSGAATLVGGTLNIPQYTGGGGGITNSAPNLHLMESDGTNAIDSGIVRSTNDYAFPGAITVVGAISSGTAPTACGTATGCYGATAASTASTQTAGQGSIRLDSTSGEWLVRKQNAATELRIPLASLGTTLTGMTSAHTYTFPDADSTMASGAAGAANQVALSNSTDATLKYATLDNTTTHALFATAGAPAFRALASGDVPAAAVPATTVTITTSSPTSVSSTLNSAFYYNQHATVGTANTYTLPTAAAGKQFCFKNSYNGSAADTGAITIATSASGQFIIDVDGTLGTTGGNIASGGAGGDGACVVGVDATHWQVYVQKGTWTKS